MNPWKALTVAALLACLAGCQKFLAERMISPPNGGFHAADVRPEPAPPADTHASEFMLKIPVGPPDAVIAAWVLSPKPGIPLHGTVLVLHGIISDHHQVSAAAGSLRDAGYRAVLIDLRGHGQSTGKVITYGVDDARDLVQVTTYLQKHDLCGKTIGVFGTSYGAASAILFAGSDPRVTAVVAVAPFATLREEAPYFGKHLLPMPGLFFSDADYTSIVDTMGKLADFNPDTSSPLAAIQKTSAHVRLFHGSLDAVIPSTSSEELAAAAPDRTELTIVPGLGHLALCFDPLGALHFATSQWFERYLAR